MLASLEEMRLGSEPDKTADYFEKKQDILFKINSLKEIQKKLHDIDAEFEKKQEDVANLRADTLKTKHVDKLKKIAGDHSGHKDVV